MIINDFRQIPEVFVQRYAQWFMMWAKNANRWGATCYFPLVPLPGRPVLFDIAVLDEHGNVPFIVVSLTAKLVLNRVVVKPTTRDDADLIKRHCATLTH